MKLVILGKGFIGTHLYRFLNEKIIDVKAFNRNELNYSDSRVLQSYIKNNRPDYIINCCGYTGAPNVDACETNKDLCINLNITIPALLNKVCSDNCIKLIHVSSGCIYSGYEKTYTEEDCPNFGLTNASSSFYSKCKHVFEVATKPYLDNTSILRIRMPFTSKLEDKNYLYKIFKYDNLINYQNSLSYVEDLNRFILFLCTNFNGGIYNIVNTSGISASTIVEMFKKNMLVNPDWNFVDMNLLNLKANRSNCVLSNEKTLKMGFNYTDTTDALQRCIESMAYEIAK
jgi:dTDP-4-dehydrorhamnose reductase